MQFSDNDIKKLKSVQKIYNSVNISKITHTLDQTKSMGICLELDSDIEDFAVVDLDAFIKALSIVGSDAYISLTKESVKITKGKVSLTHRLASDSILNPFPTLDIFDIDSPTNIQISVKEFSSLIKLNSISKADTNNLFISKNGFKLVSGNGENFLTYGEFSDEDKKIKLNLNFIKKIDLGDDDDLVSFSFNDRVAVVNTNNIRYIIAAIANN